MTACRVTEAFINTWITRWGVPLQVITDWEKQLKNELLAELSKIIGFYWLRTIAYHPHCHDLVEGFHRTIKTMILAQKESLLSILPIVLLEIHSVPNRSDFSPSYAVTGIQILQPQLLIDSTNLKPVTQSFTRELHKALLHFPKYLSNPPNLMCLTSFKRYKVWIWVDRVRMQLEAPHSGPYSVLQQISQYFWLRQAVILILRSLWTD